MCFRKHFQHGHIHQGFQRQTITYNRSHQNNCGFQGVSYPNGNWRNTYANTHIANTHIVHQGIQHHSFQHTPCQIIHQHTIPYSPPQIIHQAPIRMSSYDFEKRQCEQELKALNKRFEIIKLPKRLQEKHNELSTINDKGAEQTEKDKELLQRISKIKKQIRTEYTNIIDTEWAGWKSTEKIKQNRETIKKLHEKITEFEKKIQQEINTYNHPADKEPMQNGKPGNAAVNTEVKGLANSLRSTFLLPAMLEKSIPAQRRKKDDVRNNIAPAPGLHAAYVGINENLELLKEYENQSRERLIELLNSKDAFVEGQNLTREPVDLMLDLTEMEAQIVRNITQLSGRLDRREINLPLAEKEEMQETLTDLQQSALKTIQRIQEIVEIDKDNLKETLAKDVVYYEDNDILKPTFPTERMLEIIEEVKLPQNLPKVAKLTEEFKTLHNKTEEQNRSNEFVGHKQSLRKLEIIKHQMCSALEELALKTKDKKVIPNREEVKHWEHKAGPKGIYKINNELEFKNHELYGNRGAGAEVVIRANHRTEGKKIALLAKLLNQGNEGKVELHGVLENQQLRNQNKHSGKIGVGDFIWCKKNGNTIVKRITQELYDDLMNRLAKNHAA